jgi:hypothetical protein
MRAPNTWAETLLARASDERLDPADQCCDTVITEEARGKHSRNQLEWGLDAGAHRA